MKKRNRVLMIFPWKYKVLFIFTIRRILTHWEPEQPRKNRPRPCGRAAAAEAARLAQRPKQSRQNRGNR